MLTVRLARTDEREALESLQRRASMALDEYREQLEAEPEAIDLPMDQIEQGEVLVAEDEGEIAGMAVLFLGEQEAELDGLFVEPARWRQGIGAALVDVATHEARKRGLALMVTANPAAKAFYEKCGFRAEGETQTRFGPAFRMSK